MEDEKQETTNTKISIDDFKKIEARVGKVLVAEAVADSDKLIRFEIDFGDEQRQILSAIREWYPEPSNLIGKQLLFCTNLAPRTIRGFESNGMLMAVDGPDGAPIFLVPDRDTDAGAHMR
jgi:methionyl-tRNA synthetase